jgi:hypothetical protein
MFDASPGHVALGRCELILHFSPISGDTPASVAAQGAARGPAAFVAQSL